MASRDAGRLRGIPRRGAVVPAPDHLDAASARVPVRLPVAVLADDLDHAFFTNSGSESVDTALKIALAYHRARGEASRTRFIGRERGYHGVGFGGISVGGMVNNRKMFGTLLAGVDHLPTTYDREKMAFSKGEPEWGAHLADELERIVGIHGQQQGKAFGLVMRGREHQGRHHPTEPGIHGRQGSERTRSVKVVHSRDQPAPGSPCANGPLGCTRAASRASPSSRVVIGTSFERT
mgnify:CR=1 FL=1